MQTLISVAYLDNQPNRALVLVNEHKFVVVFVNGGTTWQMSYPLQPCMRLDLDFCLHNVPLLRSSHLWSGILHKCAFRAHEEKFATARSEGWRPDHSPLERRMDACHTLFRIESQKLTILKNQEIFIILGNTYCLTEIIVHPVIFRTQSTHVFITRVGFNAQIR